MRNNKIKHAYVGTDEFFDPATGEMKRIARIKPVGQDLNFIKLFKPIEGVFDMRPREMKLATIHVWDYFCIKMDKDNMVITTTEEICVATRYAPASIARAKTQLQEMEHIIRRAANIYMLNPEIIAVVKDRTRLFSLWQELKNRQLKLRDKKAELRDKIK